MWPLLVPWIGETSANPFHACSRGWRSQAKDLSSVIKHAHVGDEGRDTPYH
ncbi:hypothetical protein RchiOBHm_Chr5g0012111 [Rosa chinensis]|uniref:Uncharacterized protein n=1 Tax=Rosa chinensis TaxID=74649 RepID=A0A2P6Q512_ROSCH|nr:hypothetical protein RchiOBHm_Chr5g0012111 [Rosa chinensis]